MAKRFTATQLFVNRLSAYTTDQTLRQLFSPFGQIKQARLVKDQQTQRPKGFGFVTFESEDDAQKALKALNGKINICRSCKARSLTKLEEEYKHIVRFFTIISLKRNISM